MQKNPHKNGVLFPVPVQMFSCKFTGKETPSENSLVLTQSKSLKKIPFSMQWSLKYFYILKDVQKNSTAWKMEFGERY